MQLRLPPRNAGTTLPALITWPPTAATKPLPAAPGPCRAGDHLRAGNQTPLSRCHIKPPAWPKWLLFVTSDLSTENRATRQGSAMGAYRRWSRAICEPRQAGREQLLGSRAGGGASGTE